MALISLNDVSLKFAGPLLLDQVSLQIDEGERVGLLGRNGAGKTTLLKVLEGSLAPDSGDVVRRPGLRVVSLQQDVPQGLVGTVGVYLHHVCGATTSDISWEIERRIDRAAVDLSLDLDADIDTLSVGSKRRVLLAAALVRDPDILILDEPTNHLDVDAISHLEEALARRRGTIVFVTHDRTFLQNLATRILDLDRGTLRSYRTTYDIYLEMREAERVVEADQGALFDKRLAQEEAWLRQGIKARRTRNEGRVKALESMRVERGARRGEVGRVRATLQEAEKSGRVVIRCRDLTFAYDGMPIVAGFTGTLLRGDRIGILGPNGCGKTTLIDLLLGDLAPQGGTVTPGTKLEVAHFEQLSDSLDDSKSVVDNLAEGRDTITVGGVVRHVVGYLRDFLFSGDQIQGPVQKLSGGERKRLQLAMILSRPCNVLVLDEPTNDLDLETLELLEEMLLDFQGTLLVVSHDRTFLDNVVTSTLVWEGNGEWSEYAGGYADWLRQRKEVGSASGSKPAKASPKPSRPSPDQVRTLKPRRTSFKEKRELEELPGRIERFEAEKQSLFDRMASPDYYTMKGDQVAETKQQLAAVEEELHRAYERWQELESLVTGEEG
ncbi:MAG: ATP-binding cassette domain-containing protein [Candidatus Eisenbacteria bacterium]|nr:ATP-binding cassette domain-containing protein [Candidatus Eisenbacteria bacterium]